MASLLGRNFLARFISHPMALCGTTYLVIVYKGGGGFEYSCAKVTHEPLMVILDGLSTTHSPFDFLVARYEPVTRMLQHLRYRFWAVMLYMV